MADKKLVSPLVKNQLPESLQYHVDQEFPIALTVAGHAFLTGTRVDPDPQHGMNLLLLAAASDDIVALRMLALDASDALKQLPEDERAGWLLAAAGAGDPRCLEVLAQQENDDFYWLEAARAGSPRAQAYVAQSLAAIIGLGVPNEPTLEAWSEDPEFRVAVLLETLMQPLARRPKSWREDLRAAAFELGLDSNAERLLEALTGIPSLSSRHVEARTRWIPDTDTLLWEGPWSGLRRASDVICNALNDRAVKAADIVNAWGSPGALTLPSQALLAFQLDHLGVGMSPDPRFDRHRAEDGDFIRIYERGDVPVVPEEGYVDVRLLAESGVALASSDGELHLSERNLLIRWAEQEVDPAYAQRIRELLVYLMSRPDTDHRVIEEAVTSSGMQLELRATAISVILADGELAEEELALLEGIYESLGLDSAKASTDVAEVLAHGMRSSSSIMSLLSDGPPVDTVVPRQSDFAAIRKDKDLDRLVGERFALQGSPLDEWNGVSVYRAVDLWTDAPIILKSWKFDRGAAEVTPWRTEVDLLRRLESGTRSAALIEHGIGESDAWLARRRIAESLLVYVDGADYADAHERIADALQVFEAIVEAVVQLDQLVDHCCINPASVLLDHNLRAYLTDFDAGVAASRARIPAMPIQDVRRVPYVAPEVRGGHVIRHGSADVFSAAAVMVWLISGKPPSVHPRLDLDTLDLCQAEPLRRTLLEMLSDIPELRPDIETVQAEIQKCAA